MTRLVPTIRKPSAGEEPAPAGRTSFLRSALAYPVRLWRADFPLADLFWRHMVGAGTIVNLVAMGLAFLAAALGASTLAGIAIFMSPLPYNVLLVASVFRRADIERGEWAWPARLGAIAWLVVALFV